jgi:hypothetical protein
MFPPSRRATVVISIDMHYENRLALAARKNAAAAATSLIGLLSEAAIAATWGFESPPDDPTAHSLTERHFAHEIALLGDSDWAGGAAPRARFASELASRATAARASGFDISSLLLTDGDLARDLDVAVKCSLTAVRPRVVGHGDAVPKSLRYGLWRIPAAFSLTEPGRGLLRSTAATAIRIINAATTGGQLCHLTIDTGSMTTAQERTLRQVFAHIARQRIAGRLVTQTLREAAAMRIHPRIALRPARSILREAA